MRGQFLRALGPDPRLDPRSQPGQRAREGGAAHPAGWLQNREGVGWWSGRIRSLGTPRRPRGSLFPRDCPGLPLLVPRIPPPAPLKEDFNENGGN